MSTDRERIQALERLVAAAYRFVFAPDFTGVIGYDPDGDDAQAWAVTILRREDGRWYVQRGDEVFGAAAFWEARTGRWKPWRLIAPDDYCFLGFDAVELAYMCIDDALAAQRAEYERAANWYHSTQLTESASAATPSVTSGAEGDSLDPSTG